MSDDGFDPDDLDPHEELAPPRLIYVWEAGDYPASRHGFAIQTKAVNSACVEYTIARIERHQPDSKEPMHPGDPRRDGAVWYRTDDPNVWSKDRTKAERCARGSARFDGCGNVELTQHVCSEFEMHAFGVALAVAHDRAMRGTSAEWDMAKEPPTFGLEVEEVALGAAEASR